MCGYNNMISRFNRLLTLFPGRSIRMFNTGQSPPAPPFKIPLWWQLPNEAQAEMQEIVEMSTSCRQFANAVKNNLQYTTDINLGRMYQRMGQMELPLDNHYYDVMLPITKQYLKVMTRQNGKSLGKIAIAAAQLKVQDNEFWSLLWRKLYTQNIHKYIVLPDVVRLLRAMVNNNVHTDHPIVEILYATILKHQKYYENSPLLLAAISQITDKVQSIGIKKQDKPQLDVKPKEIDQKK